MTAHSDADIRLDVDLRNPGQFFACCGVLELASRLWPGSEGWFSGDHRSTSFCIGTQGTSESAMNRILEILCANDPIVELATDHERYSGDRQPVVVREPINLRMDWWLDSYRGGEKSELKVWAGQMTPKGNLLALQSKLKGLHASGSRSKVSETAGNPRLLDARIPGSGMGIDPATSWTSINVGFSPDEQNIDVLVAPATEILAMIGLQRCRPVMDDQQRRRWFIYRAWSDPMEVSVAPAALAGAARAIAAYTFPVEMRNAQYGNYGWAKPWEEQR